MARPSAAVQSGDDLDEIVGDLDRYIDELELERRRTRDAARGRAAALRRSTAWGRRPDDVIPAHVRGCGKWGVYVWKPDAPSAQVTRTVYRCGSWRCAHCAPHEAHVLFARAKEAFDGAAPEQATPLFGVLTYARTGETAPADVNEAYRELSRRSNMLLKRLRRWQRQRGMDPIGNEWTATVECHADGWPHVNVLIANRDLSEYVREHVAAHALVLDCGACGQPGCEACRRVKLFPPELMRMVTGAGFGWQSTLELAASSDKVVGYVVKVARHHDQTLGEVSKLTQLPRMAPARFRRLRSGKGFLPQRNGPDGSHTGCLAMRKMAGDGTPFIRVSGEREGLQETDPAKAGRYKQARELEHELHVADLRHRAVHRGQPAPMPPVAKWIPSIGWFGFSSRDVMNRACEGLRSGPKHEPGAPDPWSAFPAE